MLMSCYQGEPRSSGPFSCNLTEVIMTRLRKIGKLVKDACLVVGIIVLLSCSLEGSFSFAFFIKDWFSASADQSAADRRVIADAYSDPTGVNQYYEEFSRSNIAQWRPYVYWRRELYHGNYINIDTNSI
jgi:hypothetical protein